MSLRRLSAFTLSLSAYLVTFYGVILVFIYYHEQEHIGLQFYIGSGLVIAGLLTQSTYVTRGRA